MDLSNSEERQIEDIWYRDEPLNILREACYEIEWHIHQIAHLVQEDRKLARVHAMEAGIAFTTLTGLLGKELEGTLEALGDMVEFYDYDDEEEEDAAY